MNNLVSGLVYIALDLNCLNVIARSESAEFIDVYMRVRLLRFYFNFLREMTLRLNIYA